MKGGIIFMARIESYNPFVQPVSKPQGVAFPLGQPPDKRLTTAIYKPEIWLQGLWDQAKEMGIEPPASSDPKDLLEYQTRVDSWRSPERKMKGGFKPKEWDI
jgi:hypothetical protein